MEREREREEVGEINLGEIAVDPALVKEFEGMDQIMKQNHHHA